MLELQFPVRSQQTIPADHGYALFAAVSGYLPALHEENSVAIHPIRGTFTEDRRMALQPWSRVTLRVPDTGIAMFLPLAGKQLRIADATVRLGVPQVRALELATTLRSRLVIIKVAHTAAEALTPDLFLEAARKQLTALGISDQATLTIPTRPVPTPDTPPLPRRRTLRVHDAQVVGYELLATDLTAEESLTLQEKGLGGKRHMGCGVFVPVPSKETVHES